MNERIRVSLISNSLATQKHRYLQLTVKVKNRK